MALCGQGRLHGVSTRLQIVPHLVMNRPSTPARPVVAVTPMSFVRAMLAGCDRAQFDPSMALADSQIAPTVISSTDARITASQMEKLSDRLMRELDDEALGWFHRRLPWGSYGMLARASITSPNLKVAIQRWCRHHSLLTDDIQLQLSETPGRCATLTLLETDAGPWLKGDLREFCHVSLLRNLLGLSSWLVDSRIPLLGADFAFDAPVHAEAYAFLFNGPCRFGQTRTQLRFDLRYLDLPLRRDEAALRQMLTHALPLTVHSYRKDRLLVNRVKLMLISEPGTMRNAQALAEALHTSVRTLHRQLKDEGATLQGVKDDIRRETAIDMLRRTQQPIKKIALAVGFDNDKSFLRTFHKWTGLTPSQFRNAEIKSWSP